MIFLHTVSFHIRLAAISSVFLIPESLVGSLCNFVLQPLDWMFQFTFCVVPLGLEPGVLDLLERMNLSCLLDMWIRRSALRTCTKSYMVFAIRINMSKSKDRFETWMFPLIKFVGAKSPRILKCSEFRKSSSHEMQWRFLCTAWSSSRLEQSQGWKRSITINLRRRSST